MIPMSKTPKRPKDPNQLAKQIGDIATKQIDDPILEKNPHAVALGRMGGAKGGKARAEKLSKEDRSTIAKKGAAARWKNKKD